MKHITKYILIFLAILLIVWLIGFAGRSKQPSNVAPQETLRLGYLPIAECTPFFVAKNEKFFEKYGLNVELSEFDSGPTVIAASIGGSLDGGLSGVTPIFFAVDKNKPIKMVSDGGHVVPADHPYLAIVVENASPIRTLADLKGKTVAVNGLKTIEDALLRVALNKANIANSVNVVALPHPNMVPALKNGTIDASMAIEPYIATGLSSGQIRILVGSEELIPSFQISAIFFTQDFLDKKPEVVKKFIAAYNEAIDFINANPARAKEIVSDWTKTPLETAKSMTLPGWSKELNTAAVKEAQRVMVENKILERAVDLDPYFYKLGGNR